MRRSFYLALAAAALIGLASTGSVSADSGFARPYIINLKNVSGKVGQKTALVAKLTLPDGYKVLDAYRNRVIELSSYDDGVTFERPVVIGVAKNNALEFVVGVTPTKVGAHAINGVFRVGYYNDSGRMDMVSLPLIATVTGTQ
jgi:hypothetical protein